MTCGIDTRLAERRIDTERRLGNMSYETSPLGSMFGVVDSSSPLTSTTTKLEPTKPPKKDVIQNGGSKKMLDNVKNYVEKHKDVIFTLGLVIIVDHFLFKGALRTRIQQSIEGVLKKVEDTFHKGE